jgi:L-ascorbate metabolism protein UlaG (beta-lactamase superfamily)
MSAGATPSSRQIHGASSATLAASRRSPKNSALRVFLLVLLTALSARGPASAQESGGRSLIVNVAACGAPLPAPPPAGELRVRFMGVSTLLIEDSETQLLVDGFFTRPHWWTVKFGTLKPHRGRIQKALCRGGVHKPSAILVAHGHYDHAMDAAEIAADLGGVVTGSASVDQIAQGRGLSAFQRKVIEARTSWQVGCFAITAIPAPHGSPDRWEGDITAPLRPPVKAAAYRNGGGFSYLVERGGLRILVHPSAGSFPGLYARDPADVVFLGVGGLGRKDAEVTASLWREAVLRTGGSAVYPIHWDDFTRPLDRRLRDAPILDDVPKTLRRLRRQPEASRLRPRLAAFETVNLAIPPGAVPCSAPP